MSFPRDDYTPYGYLANPAAAAASWESPRGGTLRSADDMIGFGWHYPWDRGPRAIAELVIRLRAGEQLYTSRDEWSRLGLHSSYHSSLLFRYDWMCNEVAGSLSLFLDPTSADRLFGLVELHNQAPFERSLTLELWLRAAATHEPVVNGLTRGWEMLLGGEEPPHRFELVEATPPIQALITDRQPDTSLPMPAGELLGRAGGLGWEVTLAADARGHLSVMLERGADRRDPTRLSDQVDAARAEALAGDSAFYATAPLLAGDWPASWRRGWIYDLETTRLCVRPPGGIFTDYWPAWMVHFPRAVVAEGTLDMLRLGYAAPELAKRAILSLFRDAPASNIPCVFEAGEPNMVARDGSICGTSPAWCLPFYNVEALYRWTLDRAWLAQLYPYLAAYLSWWLTNRIDAEGWVVYQCTWEAGEDNSPRLDPAGEGDHVITEFTRPVELQAMMAVSSDILARLADELGQADESARWRAVASDYRERTSHLWDSAEGRFRDWDKRANRFVQPAGRSTYWGADPSRYSPLSLTPLLGVATPEQVERLANELPAYDTSPWADWPSWTYVIVECARIAGYHAMAARMAARIVERVYRRNDRHDRHGFARPLPGVAPEYWPTDVTTYGGSDGYGWGATTLSLLLRQVIGLTESEETGRWECYLTPGLPPRLMQVGREYRLINVGYRGRRFDLTYRVLTRTALQVVLSVGTLIGLRVELAPGTRATEVSLPSTNETTQPRLFKPAREHRFEVQAGQRYRLSLVQTQTFLQDTLPSR